MSVPCCTSTWRRTLKSSRGGWGSMLRPIFWSDTGSITPRTSGTCRSSPVSTADAVSDVEPSAEPAPAAHRWDEWLESIRSWAVAWPKRGFVQVFERALDEFDVVRWPTSLLKADAGVGL